MMAVSCARRAVVLGAALLAGPALALAMAAEPAVAPQAGTTAVLAVPAVPAVPAAAVVPVPSAPVAAPDAALVVPATAAATPAAATAVPGTFAGLRAALPPATTSSAASAAVASAGSLTQVAMVLLLVVGLIAGIAWLLRRLGVARNASGTTVRIVSGVSLSNRERILVVEVADQWIVVGVAPGCINTLATMPRQEAPVPGESNFVAPAGKNFAMWLKQTIDKRNGAGANVNGN